MEEKVCKTCNLVKSIDEYEKNTVKGKVYYRHSCKKCKYVKSLPSRKKYNEDNLEKIKQVRVEAYQKNKDHILVQVRQYRKDNKEKIAEARAKRYQEKKGVIKEKALQYYYANKETVNKRKNEYVKDKRKNNPVYSLSVNIRSLMGYGFNKMGFTKTNKCEDILGCTFEEFKQYIESKWEPWMSWENKGYYEKGVYNVGWDIDHIEPLFPTGIERTIEDVIRLNHYSNLQPLCSKFNRDVKKNKGVEK